MAYVMMAFRIAWFKVHRPLAFYAAYFSIRAKAFDEAFMCRGMDVCQQKMRQIIAKDKEATAVEQDMLTTLEVCYEFYLRGFTFQRMDLYQSEAIRFTVDEEHKALRVRGRTRRDGGPVPGRGPEGPAVHLCGGGVRRLPQGLQDPHPAAEGGRDLRRPTRDQPDEFVFYVLIPVIPRLRIAASARWAASQ